MPAQAQSQFDWTCWHAGVHGGFLTGNVTVDDGGLLLPGGPISGFIGGGLVGHNFQPKPGGPFILGVEADFGIANVTGTGVSMLEVDEVKDLCSYDLNWNTHVRVRAGVPIGNIMPFVAGGLAIADFDVSEASIGPSMTGGLFTGVTLGAGVDAMLRPKFIGRAEVLYDAYGSKTYDDCTVSFNTWTARVAAIFKLP